MLSFVDDSHFQLSDCLLDFLNWLKQLCHFNCEHCLVVENSWHKKSDAVGLLWFWMKYCFSMWVYLWFSKKKLYWRFLFCQFTLRSRKFIRIRGQYCRRDLIGDFRKWVCSLSLLIATVYAELLTHSSAYTVHDGWTFALCLCRCTYFMLWFTAVHPHKVHVGTHERRLQLLSTDRSLPWHWLCIEHVATMCCRFWRMFKFLVFFILVLCTYLSLAVFSIWKLNFMINVYRFIGLHVKNAFNFIKFAKVWPLVESGKAEKEITGNKN